MRYKHDAGLFAEAAAEYGLSEVTVEDAAWAVPAYADLRPGCIHSREGAMRVCAYAVLQMSRPGDWDHW